MTKKKSTPQEIFSVARSEAESVAEEIMDAIIDNNPSDPNWGHIGDTVRTRNELAAIRDRLLRLGEYAPGGASA